MNSIVVAKLFRVPLRPRFPELGNVLSGLIRSTRQKLFRPIFLVFIFHIFHILFSTSLIKLEYLKCESRGSTMALLFWAGIFSLYIKEGLSLGISFGISFHSYSLFAQIAYSYFSVLFFPLQTDSLILLLNKKDRSKKISTEYSCSNFKSWQILRCGKSIVGYSNVEHNLNVCSMSMSLP